MNEEEEIMLKELHDILHDIFQGDMSKVAKWYRTPNGIIAGSVPIELIGNGHISTVLKFVRRYKDSTFEGFKELGLPSWGS